jgi:hypothetical protein
VDENQKSAGQESLIKRESQYQSFSTIEDKLIVSQQAEGG